MKICRSYYVAASLFVGISTADAQQQVNPYRFAESKPPKWASAQQCQDDAIAHMNVTKLLVSFRDHFTKLGAAGLADGAVALKGLPENEKRIRQMTLTSKPSCPDARDSAVGQRNAWADIALKGASALSRIHGISGDRACITKKPVPGYCADGYTLLRAIKANNDDIKVIDKPAGEALLIAAFQGDLAAVRAALYPGGMTLGLENYVSADKSWGTGATPLLAAALNFGGDGKGNGASYVEVVKFLVGAKADVNATGTFNGCTSVITCIERSNKMWTGQKGHSALSSTQIDAIVANGNAAIAFLKTKGAK